MNKITNNIHSQFPCCVKCNLLWWIFNYLYISPLFTGKIKIHTSVIRMRRKLCGLLLMQWVNNYCLSPKCLPLINYTACHLRAAWAHTHTLKHTSRNKYTSKYKIQTLYRPRRMYFHIIQHGAPCVFIANRLAPCIKRWLTIRAAAARYWHNVHIYTHQYK